MEKETYKVSRRRFFTLDGRAPSVEEPQSRPVRKTYTRGDFILSVLQGKAHKALLTDVFNERLPGFARRFLGGEPGSYRETISESIVLLAFDAVTVTIGDTLLSAVLAGKNQPVIGNAGANANGDLEKELRLHPMQLWAEVTLVAPFLEEAIFRGAPSLAVDYKNSLQGWRREMEDPAWNVGIAVSALFALAHNISRDKNHNLEFIPAIPLPQFIAGLFYWHLVRQKGFSHNLLAHATQNGIPATLIIALDQIQSKLASKR